MCLLLDMKWTEVHAKVLERALEQDREVRTVHGGSETAIPRVQERVGELPEDTAGRLRQGEVQRSVLPPQVVVRLLHDRRCVGRDLGHSVR
ncbi:unnamed protein product [Leptidea sinapis]|uniref:Uncharacterized protein n=1 Tax=Leptidea sinapis TaxID=189913 RepID=A0A5E4PSI8_9NEOP|nr:unnamed protein product [Leptidea sinapis]